MTRPAPVTGTPARPSVRDLITVHRLEFPFGINTACQAVWGACFTVAGPGGLLAPAVVAAVVATLAVLLGGLVLNTAVDLDSDRRHAERGGLAGAARRLGRTAGLRLACAEFALGLVLASAVSVWTGRWLVAGAVAAAVVTQVLYNVDPVRLKARGQAGPVVFSSGVIALPFLATYAAVDGVPPVELWPVFGGLTVLAVGRVVWWSVPDVDADAAAGLRTTGVRRGPAGA
ncbi:UbiA family prenyltransferase, partial [Saccharomonospora iraqiensis]|uniref:UbiA family prenyltransferase n=1 Tax=Saccharomonospora iraqiensis TaxID=52698 RepID=UPI000698B143